MGGCLRVKRRLDRGESVAPTSRSSRRAQQELAVAQRHKRNHALRSSRLRSSGQPLETTVAVAAPPILKPARKASTNRGRSPTVAREVISAAVAERPQQPENSRAEPAGWPPAVIQGAANRWAGARCAFTEISAS